MISVVLPAYNSEKTIEIAMSSVLQQTYSDLELIVVINGCIDATEDIVNDLAKKDKRVKVCHSKEGMVTAINTGFRLSLGDIIAIQNHDDEWYDFKLESQLADFNDCDILGTQIDISLKGNISKSNYPCSHEDCVNQLINAHNPIANPSVIFKKSILDKVGGYWDFFPLAEDMDFWMRCIPFFKFKNTQFVGMKYNLVPKLTYDHQLPHRIANHYRNLYESQML